MAKKKVLITGVCGLLGQNLVRMLAPDYDLTGVDILPRPGFFSGLSDYKLVDITHPDEVGEAVERAKPDLVINTAAITNVDACETEKEKTDALNHRAVRTLLKTCGKSAKFVQISSDYVFDGKSGPYADDAEPNPVSFYGITKLRAEEAVQEHSADHLIVRTMVLFGTAVSVRPDFIAWVRNSLSANREISAVTDQVGNITLASNLAANIGVLLNRNISGIVSLSGSDLLSRHAIAIEVAKRYGFNAALVRSAKTEDLKQAAPRPLNSGFLLNRARTVPGVNLLTFQEQMKVYDDEQKSADRDSDV